MGDMPETPEPELLARLRAGDQAALADLYDRYRDRLRRMVAVRLDPRLACRVAASDILQEAYIDALKRYGLVRGSVLAGWRLLRCNPWSHGGVDRVDDQRLFAS